MEIIGYIIMFGSIIYFGYKLKSISEKITLGY